MRYRILWAAWIVLVALGFGGLAYAQDAPTLQPAASVNATAFVDAFKGHQWALLAALGIYTLASLSKQGWLGTWLQDHLPKRMLPFLAPLIGLLVLSTGEMIFGRIPWPTAILDGVLAGWLPIIGHEVVIESMRNGKEIIPEKKVGGDGATPSLPRTSESVASAPSEHSGSHRGVATFAFAMPFAFLLAFCTPQERAIAKTIADFVLSGSQLACVEMSTLSNSKDVAQACKIDLQAAPDVESFLDNLLVQKAAARRSGFEWHGPPPRTADDAGM